MTAPDDHVQLQADGPGKKVDASAVSTTDGSVFRQRVAIGSPSDGAHLAEVSAAPTGAEPGLLTRNIHPPLVGLLASLPDVAATSTPTAFGSLARGPVGILVTVHPSSTGVVRISGSDVSTAQGTPLAANGSLLVQVANANQIHFVLEGAGAASLSALAV